MASVKIILRKKANKDGKHSLAIQIIKDRKMSLIHLGQHLRADEWDAVQQRVKKSHPNSVRLNNFLIQKLAETNDRALEIESTRKDASASAIRKSIKPTGGATFFAQADLYIEGLKAAGKYNQYTAEKPRVKRFRKFIGHDISFQDITPVMLERFKNHLIAEYKVGERTAVNHLVVIRSVFSQAIKDNVTDMRYYPFGKGKVKIKFPDSHKSGLTIDEIKRLEAVQLPDDDAHHARNLWLTSFYFAGMRISDVLRMRWSDIQDGRFTYTMGKNNKTGSLKIPEKAKKIIEQYEQFRQNKNDLIFPELKGCDFDNKFNTQRTIAFKISALDKCLRKDVAPKAGIDKTLTMHIARHSFAQNATDIDVRTLQHLFRHSKLETTEGYMGQFRHDKADDALDSVLAFEPQSNWIPLKTHPQKFLYDRIL